MELDVTPLFDRDLPPLVSLQMVDMNNRVVFEATGKWLYPLFFGFAQENRH